MFSDLRGHETDKGATHMSCANVLLSPLFVYLRWTSDPTSKPNFLSILCTSAGLVPRGPDLTYQQPPQCWAQSTWWSRVVCLHPPHLHLMWVAALASHCSEGQEESKIINPSPQTKMPVETLCSGLPSDVSMILMYVHMLAFSETPNYDYIQ